MRRTLRTARIRPVVQTLLLAAAIAAPAVRARAELVASPDRPVGWRGDGSGRFPDALPVTKWSQTSNVVWKAAMPGWTISHPVVVGDVVFTSAEPTTLLCLRRSDGRILWRRTHEFEDMLSPAMREKVKRDLATAAGLRKSQLRTLTQGLNEIKQELRFKSKDSAILRRKAGLEGRIKALKERLAALEKYRPVPPHRTRGHSFATPVSDGQRVYVFFGNGVAAAYDLAGERKWIRWVRRPATDYAPAMSPVLVGRTLVVSINDRIVGLRAANGSDAWEAKVARKTGGFVLGRVGKSDVVVTAGGEIYRGSDGKRLIQMGFPARAHYSTPVIHEGVLYFLGEREHVLARRLVDERGAVRLKGIAAALVPEGTYYASPLVHDGRVYVCESRGKLCVVDARTGSWIGSKKLRLGGQAHPSPTLGGTHIFVGSDNGVMSVLKPTYVRSGGTEPTFKLPEVARNQLEPGRGCPVFAGWQMFWRSYKSLYCIGEVPPNGGGATTGPARPKGTEPTKPAGVSLRVLLGEVPPPPPNKRDEK